MFIYLNRVEVIRCNLEEFDRELADQIKPLALFYEGFDVDGKGTMEQKMPGDSLSDNFVYQKVIDKICTLNVVDPQFAASKVNRSLNPDEIRRKHQIAIT